MIRITIESTGKNSLRGSSYGIETTNEFAFDIKGAQELLIDRYGKLPGGKNKVYEDDKDGRATVVGFTHSFWNKDWSHDSKPWFQTDWITAVYVVETPVNILVKSNGTK